MIQPAAQARGTPTRQMIHSRRDVPNLIRENLSARLSFICTYQVCLLLNSTAWDWRYHTIAVYKDTHTTEPRFEAYHVNRTRHSFSRQPRHPSIAYPSRPSRRPIHAGFVQRYTLLQNDLEYNLELFSDYLRLHLGCCSPKYSEC